MRHICSTVLCAFSSVAPSFSSSTFVKPSLNLSLNEATLSAFFFLPNYRRFPDIS